MTERNHSSEDEESYSETDLARIEAQGNTNAISRAVAVMVLMVIPGIAGHYLDRWFGTQFLVLVGFVIGICLAVFGLLYVAKIADLTAKHIRERKLRMKSQKGERS
jgi:F0F1-type ATP synthase assembly protein I